jgi:hypothetical protein
MSSTVDNTEDFLDGLAAIEEDSASSEPPVEAIAAARLERARAGQERASARREERERNNAERKEAERLRLEREEAERLRLERELERLKVLSQGLKPADAPDHLKQLVYRPIKLGAVQRLVHDCLSRMNPAVPDSAQVVIPLTIVLCATVVGMPHETVQRYKPKKVQAFTAYTEEERAYIVCLARNLNEFMNRHVIGPLSEKVTVISGESFVASFLRNAIAHHQYEFDTTSVPAALIFWNVREDGVMNARFSVSLQDLFNCLNDAYNLHLAQHLREFGSP